MLKPLSFFFPTLRSQQKTLDLCSVSSQLTMAQEYTALTAEVSEGARVLGAK
jgi:hypothetical protein